MITNVAPLPPFTAAIGKSRYPDLDQIKSLITAKTHRLIAFDAAAQAKEAGNLMSLNIVLLGALCRTELLPLTTDAVREAIRTRTKQAFVEANLRAFDLGYQAA